MSALHSLCLHIDAYLDCPWLLLAEAVPVCLETRVQYAVYLAELNINKTTHVALLRFKLVVVALQVPNYSCLQDPRWKSFYSMQWSYISDTPAAARKGRRIWLYYATMQQMAAGCTILTA